VSDSDRRPDYGLDAPGLVRFFLGLGVALIVLAIAGHLGAPVLGLHRPAQWMGGSFFATGLAMMWSSRVGKLRARDRLLDGLGLAKNARVLDLGCGRGLLLLGAAKRCPEGEAVGIDLWSGEDLSDNNREATMRNARAEGVAERVSVHDGDMRELPFEDASFDAVVGCFSIHNIPDAAGRAAAVREAYRVLRPGGRVAILDLGRTGEYARALRDAGASEVERSGPWLTVFPPARLVAAKKAA
jgi:SAM-dependent methyltransferase